MTVAQQLYPFSHPHAEPPRGLAHLLGGKGAGLAEMTTALGLPVPPGFTVPVEVCVGYRSAAWPTWLDDSLRAHVDALGELMGRRFGDPDDPLLLAVRSGAARSMPGMLDTVLNLGLNQQTVRGLERWSGDAAFAWDSYCRFLTMFATTVFGVDHADLPRPTAGRADQKSVADLAAAIEGAAGRPVPEDPFQQLRAATEAVFRSWDSSRAVAYRRAEGIDDDLGTAVNVQAMVFGNRGHDSGTGVVFTRSPASGAPELYGDYLPRAQGEDVVAGTATPLPIAALADHLPAVHTELGAVLRRLEVHYRDLCDVEFTVECGRLWILQTRIGKRGALAAARIAVSLVDDPDIRLAPAEALARVPAELRARARQDVAGGVVDGVPPLATGLGASPGRVSGRAVFSCSAALDAEDDVLLVRPETSPQDVAGMSASVGVLTLRGGLVSHAAVVARGWHLPAVVGADQLSLRGGQLVAPDGTLLTEGTVLTIDGSTGQVWLGDRTGGGPVDVVAVPELDRLDSWEQAR